MSVRVKSLLLNMLLPTELCFNRKALNLMPRALTSHQFYDLAYRLYQSGVERFFFWDGLGRTGGVGRWRKVPRLGHRQEVEEWFEQGRPSLRPACRLWSVDGWDLRMETPG